MREDARVALGSVTRSVVERAFDRISPPDRPSNPPWLRDAWEQMDREFLTVPPLTLHLPVPALFVGFWAAFRESVLAGASDRLTREVIAAAVSAVNECPFCVDAHTASTSALGDDGAAKALRAGSVDAIARPDLRAAARWAAATRSPGDPALASPPFKPEDLPYAIATALAFHYVNRMVSAFLKPSVVRIPSFIERRPFMTRFTAVFPGRLLGAGGFEPGASLAFCPSSPTAPELAKLDEAPTVAAGWAALVRSADEAGAAVLPASSRSAIARAIDAWEGTDPGFGSVWIEDVVGSLPQDEQPAATFALVCALAPYRVDRGLVEVVRRTHPTDGDLVSIAAWASMRATLRIAAWV
jgi:AhpD family alkylhydroperoxidase